MIHENVLFRKDHSLNNWQVVLPRALNMEVTDQIHSKLAHPGYYNTLMYIKQFFYWKSMSSDIKKFVVTCDMCQRIKPLSYKMEGEFQFIKSDRPGDLVTVDFYGSLPKSIGGVEYIFMCHQRANSCFRYS